MPRRGASNEYTQNMFLWRNKKNINTFGLKKSTLTSAMYFSYFSQKIGLNISCKLSPKCQILFSGKHKYQYFKMLALVDFCHILRNCKFQDIHNLMSEGNKSRTVAATNMNSESSRSHAVFSIILTQTLTDLQTSVSGENIITCTTSKTSPSELLRS